MSGFKLVAERFRIVINHKLQRAVGIEMRKELQHDGMADPPIDLFHVQYPFGWRQRHRHRRLLSLPDLREQPRSVGDELLGLWRRQREREPFMEIRLHDPPGHAAIGA